MRLPALRFGFTLIEMMVVITISGILVAGGLAAYKGISEKENLKQAGLTMESNLKLAARRAQAGDKPENCGGSLTSFSVSAVGGDNTKYQIQALCSSASAAAVEYVLGDGVEFQQVLPTPIEFLPLRNGVIGGQTITLTTTSGAFSYQVIVESSGVIRGNLL